MAEVKFIKETDKAAVGAYLAGRIQAQLEKGGRVLWLLSGGSAIGVAVSAAKNLTGAENLSNLTIGLADERYGAADHPDSNWVQIQQSGFRLQGANLHPVLEDKSLEQTARDYEQFLVESIEKSSLSIALAGIGADGHTFGIKPHSPAVTSGKLIEAYQWDDYVRITPTFKLLQKLDSVVVYAVGQEKRSVLKEFDKHIAVDVMPAQLLKGLRETIIFNDIRGERL